MPYRINEEKVTPEQIQDLEDLLTRPSRQSPDSSLKPRRPRHEPELLEPVRPVEKRRKKRKPEQKQKTLYELLLPEYLPFGFMQESFRALWPFLFVAIGIFIAIAAAQSVWAAIKIPLICGILCVGFYKLFWGNG